MKYLIKDFLSHENNLDEKLRKSEKGKDNKFKNDVANSIKEYSKYRTVLNDELLNVEKNSLKNSVDALNAYVDFAKDLEKNSSKFNWRSDYAGSIIPEFLYIVSAVILNKSGILPNYSFKQSVVEFVLTGTTDSGFQLRRKNQDFSFGYLVKTVSFQNEEILFVIPNLVAEVKTNIDINKLSGLNFSAERLKRTFPDSFYFLVTETIDFSLNDNYASGSIDEIYVLRKQMRSKARKSKEDLDHTVFELLMEDILKLAKQKSSVKGHVYERLEKGKLIND